MLRLKNLANDIYSQSESPENYHFIIVNAIMTKVLQNIDYPQRKREYQEHLENIVENYTPKLELDDFYCETDGYNGTFFLLVIRSVDISQNSLSLLRRIVVDIKKIKGSQQGLKEVLIYRPIQNRQSSMSKDDFLQEREIERNQLNQNVASSFLSSIDNRKILQPSDEQDKQTDLQILQPSQQQDNLKNQQQDISDKQSKQQFQEIENQKNTDEIQNIKSEIKDIKMEIAIIKELLIKIIKQNCKNSQQDIDQKIDYINISGFEREN